MSDEPVIRITGPAEQKGPQGGKGKPKGLGRGLGALMGETRREESLTIQSAGIRNGGESEAGLAMLAISDVVPNPDQPRTNFDDASLEELAASIAHRGVIQPIIVRPQGKDRYQLVAGERRWRAAQRAQLHEIPAIIRDLGDRDVMALALIENLQREDLNPIEEARAFQRLTDEEDLTQAEIARLVDKSRSHVANFLRLLSLPDPVIALVEQGELSMGHAKALVGSEDATEIARLAITKKLSVREVEKLVKRKARGNAGQRRARVDREPAGNADITAVQDHLEEFLGLPVRINADADPRSGSVTIRYGTLDQLDLICQRLTGGSI